MSTKTRLTLISTMGILIISLLTFGINRPARACVTIDVPSPVVSSENPSSGYDSDEQAGTVITPEFIPVDQNPLIKEAVPEIHDLVVNYLNAQLDGTLEAFVPYVTTTAYIDLDEIAKSVELVRSFDDFVCYEKKGAGPIDYIVFFTYNSMIPPISTPVPSLNAFYVSYEDGVPKVFFGLIDDNVQDYIDKITSTKDVNDLIEATDKAFDEACANDEDLYEFYHKMEEKIDPEAEAASEN